jgi:Xaa-Pro aminopeptidase
MARFRDAVSARELDAVVIYGDREHFANFAYLTGFDPRFEEALLILGRGKEPVILTGPENLGIAGAAPIGAEARLCRSFGLLGQLRTAAPTLAELLRDAGLSDARSIGVVGWKYFTVDEAGDAAADWIDIPAFIADALRSIAPLRNVTDLLMHPSYGLRASLEVEEIVRMEFAASHGSEAMKRVIFGLRPGMREYDAASLMRPIGLPLAAHPMLSSGPRAAFGLHSPSDRIIEKGDPFMLAFCYRGSSAARAGFVAFGPEDLPEGAHDYATKLVAPYFEAAAAWYETIRIGVAGGTLDHAVRSCIGTPFFNLLLNPGHLIHLDEWVNTPIYPESAETLHAGSAVQLDIIPATGGIYHTTNIEDGVVLLDDDRRSKLREQAPDVWERMQARRAFMADLGIKLAPEVLPMSNISGYLPPYLLAPQLAMSLA